MSKFQPRPPAKPQAARPNAAMAKLENERYATFQARLERIAAAANGAGNEALAEELADLGQRVADHEITLEEGADELRDHETAIRAMLRR